MINHEHPFIKKHENIVIWGCGQIGKRVYDDLKPFCHVDAFCDSYQTGDYKGIPIISPSCLKKNQKIVIAVGRKFIDEIIRECIKQRQFFYEFVPYEFIYNTCIDLELLYLYEKNENTKQHIIDSLVGGRKRIVILGNCQIEQIIKYLNACNEYNRCYATLLLPPIHMISDKKITKEIIYELHGKTDVFVTQNIKKTNRFFDFYDTENLCHILVDEKKNMTTIRIATLYFDGYFPQGGVEPNPYAGIVDGDPNGAFPYTDAVINDLVHRFSAKQIVQIVQDPDFFSERFIDNYLDWQYKNAVCRDKYLDVTLTDYIFKNYIEKQLFYARNHPTNEVIEQLVKRLLAYLGVTPIFDDLTLKIPELSIWQELIYPSTEKHLQLKFSKKTYSDGLSHREKHTFSEEVERYIRIGYYGEKNDGID